MGASTAVQIPTWQLDPTHSSVEFSVKHMMMTTVRGRFKTVQATLRGDRDHPEEAGVEATIDAASIDTGVADRDGHLRSPDFLDVEAHPVLTFRSTGVLQPKDNEFRLVGDLTIRDVTREVRLAVEFDGVARSPWGKDVIAFTATTEIDREEFGITWNQALEAGGVLVGRKVKIELQIEATRQI